MFRKLLSIIAVLTLLHPTYAHGNDRVKDSSDHNPGNGDYWPDNDSPSPKIIPFSTSEDNRTFNQKVSDRWYGESGTDVMGFFRDNDFAETGNNILKFDTNTSRTLSGQNHYDTITHLLDYNAYPASGMNGPQAKSALGSYTGHSFSNSAQAAHSNVKGINRAMLRHVDDINKTIVTDAPLEKVSSEEALASVFNPQKKNTEERFWIGGTVLHEELRDGSDGMPGYKYSGGGILTGYDHTMGALSVGGAIGYSGGAFKDKSALSDNSSIDSYAANLYATYNPGGKVRASAIAGYASSDVRLRKQRAGMAGDRAVNGVETAKYGVDSYSLGGRVGYETDFKDIIKLGVTGGFQYQYSRTGAFDAIFWGEGGGVGGSVMKVGQMRNNSFAVPIDITADYVVKSTLDSSLTVSANAGYGFEFANKGAHGSLSFDGLNSGSDMNFSSRAPGRNSVNLGAGVAYENDKLDVTAKYDVYMKSDYTAHQVTGNMGVKF